MTGITGSGCGRHRHTDAGGILKGQLISSSAVADGRYSSTPRSAAGRFIVVAVEALSPTPEWTEKHRFPGMPVRAGTTADPPHRARAIHIAMRNYVATEAPAKGRRGRPRGSQATL